MTSLTSVVDLLDPLSDPVLATPRKVDKTSWWRRTRRAIRRKLRAGWVGA